MSLIADIQQIKERTLSDLDSAHDYYIHTKYAWGILQNYIKTSGEKFILKNLTTGNAFTENDLLGKTQDYIAEQLAESTFQQFLSIFDAFFSDFLQVWLKAYPASLQGKQLHYKVVLDAPDIETISLHVINKELNEVLYKRPKDWFSYLNNLVQLDCPPESQIEQFAEAKAARDILVHNRGNANESYLQKAGKLARTVRGERIEISESYHQSTWRLIRTIVEDIVGAAIDKLNKG
jgi:hypothetical protein